MPRLNGFIPLFALGEVALFSLNAVANAAAMWTVPLRLRSLACALVTITIHVLGDVPAPPIVGRIQDDLNRKRGPDPNNWRTSLSIVVCALLVAVVLFGAGAWVSKRRAGGPPVPCVSPAGRTLAAAVTSLSGDFLPACWRSQGGGPEVRRGGPGGRGGPDGEALAGREQRARCLLHRVARWQQPGRRAAGGGLMSGRSRRGGKQQHH